MKYKNLILKSLANYCLLCCLLLVSCNEEQRFTDYEIAKISFKLPSSFKFKKLNSEDSMVYGIFYNNVNKGYVYFGNYKPFEENSFFITEEKELYEKYKNRELKAYFSKNQERDYKNGIFNDNYYYYDTINKNIAQIMLPKKPNKGLIGIYFDSIDSRRNKFVIISNDLSEENKKVFLKIFKTIKTK
ncbi:hypothetical protein J2787_000866 [Chryseobacterium rhizosphaerae]|uniref:Lipoprotein n=1 Tax=Chryseobacterium rhizosphaerae TaxID=395937 RepID=A0AAE4C0L2_9FLAO|nr:MULTISPECIES: hypothetical protein [Chryseobacterium]MBL3550538.1 hypothetical protein [Chryseobacterium sp. KMC2]MDR6525496.1 hypothetical protein [Chryseobacterium rhizosphaerae]